MSRSLSITVSNVVFEALERKIKKLAEVAVPGTKANTSAYVTSAIKEKLIRDGEEIVY